MKQYLLILAACGMFVWAGLISIRSAAAHGGGVAQLANEPAGPYLVSVWTQPEQPLAGQTAHVTIALAEPAADGTVGGPVLDAAVTLQARPVAGGATTVTAVATHADAANRLFYESDLTFPEAGNWEVGVYLDGPGGPAETSLSLSVQQTSPRPWPWLVVAAGVLVGAIWGWNQRRSPNRARVEST